MAKEFKVGQATVRHAAEYAIQIDDIEDDINEIEERYGTEIKIKILSGELPMTSQETKQLSELGWNRHKNSVLGHFAPLLWASKNVVRLGNWSEFDIRFGIITKYVGMTGAF